MLWQIGVYIVHHVSMFMITFFFLDMSNFVARKFLSIESQKWKMQNEKAAGEQEVNDKDK